MPRLVLSPEERIGQMLAGKYRFERVLGAGGMGTVFGGVHTWTNRPVAIKLLNDSVATDAGIAERFLWEARAAAEIRHPNVVDVLDMGTGDDGAVYMVLEWLEGESLADLLDRERPMRPDKVVRLLAPIMAALAHAHAAGIVHRDIKPDNIFVSKDKLGRTVPKLLDFGVAKVAQRSQDANDKRTETGMVIGTPQYMSPEQAVGDTTVGPAADVWSVGAVMFECLAGRLPFGERTSAALLIALNTQDAPSLASVAPHLSAPLVAVVDRALKRRRDARWDGITTMLRELVRACAASDIRLDDATRQVIAATDESAASPSLAPLPPESGVESPSGSAAQPAPAPEVVVSANQRSTRPLRAPPEGGSPVTPMTRMGSDVEQRRAMTPPLAGSADAGPSDAGAQSTADTPRPSTGFSWSGNRGKAPPQRRWGVIAAAIGVPLVVLAAIVVGTVQPWASGPPDVAPVRPVRSPEVRTGAPSTPSIDRATPSPGATITEPSTQSAFVAPATPTTPVIPDTPPAPSTATTADAGTIAATAATDASSATATSPSNPSPARSGAGGSRPPRRRSGLDRTW